ncbi:nuclear receptor subfamily 0, group B, member 2b [Carassius carassius]|uniref:nuclear receptor subfamily 0, group B, member 2b n=1 Tax=Carassius carassius TaxID=217509 RepID=UPI002868A7E0|nr:nuclear receptor subfamily 0, group B, member 2b [Carassius carassius]
MRQFFSDGHPRGLLFSILNRECDGYPDTRGCHCQRLVCLRNPETTCRVAFGVLIRTIHFMKSLPSFRKLALRDRLVLVEKRWVALFLLGLAQEHVTFEVRVVPAASILRNILMSGRQKSDECRPTLGGVQKLKTFLNKVWSLDLSLREFAGLKGAVLFSPDAAGPRSSEEMAGLQEEAQRALHTWPTDQRSLTHLLFMASALRAEAQSLVTELFFRPIAGQMDLHKLLHEMIVKQ